MYPSAFQVSPGQEYSKAVAYQPLTLGPEFFELTASGLWVPRPFARSPLWTRMHEDFNPEHFLYPAPPAELGHVPLPAHSLEPLKGLRVLRCPLKEAGHAGLRVPVQLLPLEPLIRFVLELEASVNANWWKGHCHVSFEYTEVRAGHTQRVPGWHVDGFQGVRVARHQIEHSYLWANSAPTQYCLQPFFVSHLDPARHNVFATFEEQAKESNVFDTFAEHLYLIDPYVVHRAQACQESGWRAFFRLTFTPTELEDPNNTVNAALPQPQSYPPRIEVRNRLTAYRGAPPWAGYGVRPAMGAPGEAPAGASS